MDDVLRRRLVGATVLLSLAFGLASLLPEPRRARGEEPAVRYDLRSGRPLAAAPSAPAQAPKPAAPPQLAPAPPRLKVDETLGGAIGGWYVQVGSFENQANARRVLQRLYGAGLPTVIQSIPVGKTLWYRVRVGPFDGEDAAQRALGTIRKEGYAGAKVVRPDSGPAAGTN